MKEWSPLETAWPAGVALLIALGALAFGAAGALRDGRARLRTDLALVGVALGVRLLLIPSLTRHVFDGHEAEYWDLFQGVRAPNRGGTVLYPAMQWLWWGFGRVLPHHPLVPVLLMAGVGAVGVLLVTAMVRRLANPTAGWIAGLLVALHPVHAAWSSSAYNVILPSTLGAGLLLAAATLATRRRVPWSVAWLAAALWALVVSTRLDAALIGLPALLLVLLVRPRELPLRTWAAERVGLLLPAAVGLGLGAAAAFPLVFPAELPGSGERLASLQQNLLRGDPYFPVHAALFLGLVGWAAIRALPIAPAAGGALLVGALANHLLMASFDDLGDRHLLTALPAFACLVGVGLSRWARARDMVLVGGLLFGLAVQGLGDTARRFYASEEDYALRLMQPPWWGLPRWTVDEARTRAGQACGWISEDPRVADAPPHSHFNLVDPAEGAALRGPDGCLRWCVDLQDYRWSSRGVRDRALRLADLMVARPVAVLEAPLPCLVVELGTRAGAGVAFDPGDPGSNPSPHPPMALP